MDIRKIVKIDQFNFYLNVPLEECLEILEAYKRGPNPSLWLRKVEINLTVVKPNSVYHIQASRSPLAFLEAEIEAEGDISYIHGSSHLNTISVAMMPLSMGLILLLTSIADPKLQDSPTLWLSFGCGIPFMLLLALFGVVHGLQDSEEFRKILTNGLKQEHEDEMQV